MKHVLEALNLTQFGLPQSEISPQCRINSSKVVCEAEQTLEVGLDLKTEDV